MREFPQSKIQNKRIKQCNNADELENGTGPGTHSPTPLAIGYWLFD